MLNPLHITLVNLLYNDQKIITSELILIKFSCTFIKNGEKKVFQVLKLSEKMAISEDVRELHPSLCNTEEPLCMIVGGVLFFQFPNGGVVQGATGSL